MQDDILPFSLISSLSVGTILIRGSFPLSAALERAAEHTFRKGAYMKRILTLFCVIAMVLLMFACSGGGGGGGGGQQNPQLSGTVKVEGGSNQ